MKTKTIYLLSAIAILFLIFINCFTYIPPGYTGVCINVLAKEDIQDSSLFTGVHFLFPWKRVWKFPLFEQNVSWEDKESFRFQTSEGLASDADIGITFCVNPEKVPELFRRYRSGINEISHKFLRNYLRDAITVASSSRGIEELYGRGKEQFLREIEEVIRVKLEPLGILVSRVYLVDAFEFPQAVVKALNQKIEAAQRAEQRENELRESEAQAKKDIAQAKGQANSTYLKAEAQAKANRLLAESLTKELVIYEGLQKWDGKLPTVMSEGVLLKIKEDK